MKYWSSHAELTKPRKGQYRNHRFNAAKSCKYSMTKSLMNLDLVPDVRGEQPFRNSIDKIARSLTNIYLIILGSVTRIASFARREKVCYASSAARVSCAIPLSRRRKADIINVYYTGEICGYRESYIF
jgi:hypothetical protein